MPVMAPFLVKGLTLNAWALAKPLILLVLIPLLIGVALRHYKERAADQDLPCGQEDRSSFPADLPRDGHLAIYGKQMLETAGSLATAA